MSTEPILPPDLSPAEQRRAEVIEPGYTFSGVTDKIASIVLARKTPKASLTAVTTLS